jgi:pimeloyl-ACP methyl ester carboxylesterase
MFDLQYGAVLRPEWSSEIVREEHPSDESSVYTVHESVAESLRHELWSPEPLMLLHGVGNSGAIYGPVMPSLASMGPVSAPTMAPELLATGTERREDAVARLVEWLSELTPPPWRLVGHSMGGILTGLILRSHPEVVSSAVLLNSPLPGTIERLRKGDTLDRNGRALLALKGLSRITAFGRPRLPRFLRGTELAIVRTALNGFVQHPGALDARVISRAILRSRTTDGIDFLRMARELPVWESDPFEGCPVAIIVGDDDPLVPMSDLDMLAASYPAASVDIAHGCGHFAHLERPGLTLELMTSFYESTSAGTSPN